MRITSAKMEAIFDEVVSDEDLKKFEHEYNKQLAHGPPSQTAQFNYAWCLVRARRKADVKHGVHLLEELCKKSVDDNAKRDYLYYAAIGCTKTSDYDRAQRYVDAILKVQPGNHQAEALKAHIKHKMKKEGLIGMAVVGGAAAIGIAGIGALIGLAVAKK